LLQRKKPLLNVLKKTLKLKIMKIIYHIAFLLFISLYLSFASKAIQKENTLIAIFIEVTDEDYFKFIDVDEKNFYSMTYKKTLKLVYMMKILLIKALQLLG
jgi:hypothetical protein